MRNRSSLVLSLVASFWVAACNCGPNTPPVSQSVEIAPATVEVVLGRTEQFTAVPADVDWSVEGGDANGTISAAGLYSAPTSMPAAATVTIVAALKGDSERRGTAAVVLTADGNPVVSLTIAPSAVTLAPGASQQLTLTATLQDGSTRNVTAQALWTSQALTVATVSSGRVESVTEGTAIIDAAYGGRTASINVVVTAGPALTAVSVSPATASIAKNTSQQFQATGNYADGSTRDITATVTWSSSNTSIATVTSAGAAQGLLAGTATITANLAGAQGSAQLTVTDVTLTGISVTPPNPSIPLAASVDLTATGTFSDGTSQDVTAQVTWMSSDSAKVSVTTTGRATGVAAGTATVTAALGAVMGQTQVTVTTATLQSISVTPPAPTRAKGVTVQFAATGQYSDQTTLDLTSQVTWSSTDTAVASISNAPGSRGLATAIAAGSSSIRATLGGTVGTTALTVTDATLISVAVKPSTGTLPAGATLQLSAEGTFSDGSKQNLTDQATWTSSAVNIATVDDGSGQKGLATGVAAGTATVTATVQARSGTATLTVTSATLQSIAVTPASSNLARGTARAFTATGTYSDGTTQDVTDQVTWASSATNVATVSNAAADKGLVTAVNPGTSTISATFGTILGSTLLTVTNATLQTLLVTPGTSQVAKGKTQQLTATGTFSDNSTQNLTTQVTWSSSNASSVSVSNAAGSEGLATALSLAIQPATLTATFGAVSDTATITVTAATIESLQITPDPATVPVNDTRQLTATALFSDGTTQNVTNATNVNWTSSNTSLATVTNPAGFPPGGAGVVTGVAVGIVTITVTLGGKTDTVQLTVNTATLQSITVTPANSSLPKSFGRQFKATGNYTDASTKDLTATVTWTSSSPNIATVNVTGFVTATATPGVTTITAATGGAASVSGNTSLTVTNATPSSLDITPAAFTIKRQESRQLTAIATFSDGSTLDVTTRLTWTSSAQQVAFVDTRGLVTGGFLTGTSTITGTIPNTAINDTSAATVVP